MPINPPDAESEVVMLVMNNENEYNTAVEIEYDEENEVVTEKDVLLQCCGEDEDGESKGLAVIKLCDLNIDTEAIKDIDVISLDTPIINVFRSAVSTIVDLTFTDLSDYEFLNAVARLNDFMRMDFEPESDNVVRSIVLSITPKEIYTTYLSTGMHGVWNIQPSSIGGPLDTIRFFFSNEFFGTFDVENMNTDVAAVNYEEEEREVWDKEY